MTISVSQIGWSHYHSNEGPFFGGKLSVSVADRADPFYDRVFSLVSAAEGNFDAINMYDTGLVSVGAIQFIDAGNFQVTDMLGAVADALGPAAVTTALQPALDLCGATFFKSGTSWRFSLGGQTVNTLTLQRQLYFGDASGNAAGSFDDAKKLRAKTWAACLASVWYAPGATDVQKQFAIPRLINGFVWGQLKADLFSGDQPTDGWVGALRAMLLAFAVNAPAVVVKRYAACRDNGQPTGSAAWCLAVLRGVVANSGIDVWPARWVAQVPLVARMFGVSLPSYQQLVAGSYPAPVDPTPAPPPAPAPDPQPAPDPAPPPPPDSQPDPPPPPLVPPDPPPPAPAPIVSPPSGAFATLVQLVKIVLEVIARVLGKRPS